MDFKSFTEKLTDLGTKALDASVTALGKTTDFTYENLGKTPVMLKTAADFEAVRTDRNLVILVLAAQDESVTKNLVLQLPLLFSKAWINSATLKTIVAADSPDLVAILEAPAPGVLVYREGILKSKLQGEQIAEFVTDFDIRKDYAVSPSEPKLAPTPEEAAKDPLNS